MGLVHNGRGLAVLVNMAVNIKSIVNTLIKWKCLGNARITSHTAERKRHFHTDILNIGPDKEIV